MNSWHSKITLSLALLTACGTLNSCRLGAGKYSSQTEVETDVPDSLEHGKPSAEPAAAGAASYATSNGVPATSNLIETTDTMPSPGDLTPLPTIGAAPSLPGGASLNSNPSDSIDLPKPDFANVSVHNPRSPAQMLTLENPLKNGPRMSAAATGSKPYTTGIVRDSAPPAPSVTVPPPAKGPSDTEIANAPKATKSSPPEPGVPLLHGGARLSDFYAEMHQALLDHAVVDNSSGLPANEPPPVPAPAPDDAAIPAPPPDSRDFAAPQP